jgi:hypothetical protein
MTAKKCVSRPRLVPQLPDQHIPTNGPADITHRECQQYHRHPEYIHAQKILYQFVPETALSCRNTVYPALVNIGHLLLMIKIYQYSATDAEEYEVLNDI